MNFKIATIMVAGMFLAASAATALCGDGKKAGGNGSQKKDADKGKADKDKPNGGNCDKRQERQAKRIEHGIKKGYLTADEIAKLESQQKAIAEMEANFKSDAKLTKDERKKLQDALNEASRCIWAEKHDTDGKQMPTYRLGKNIFARDELTSALANENLAGDQAKKYAADFKRIMNLKHSLSAKDLTAEERTKLQNEYNELLNKYFEVREPAATSQPAK